MHILNTTQFNLPLLQGLSAPAQCIYYLIQKLLHDRALPFLQVFSFLLHWECHPANYDGPVFSVNHLKI